MKIESLFERLSAAATEQRPRALHETVSALLPAQSEPLRPLFTLPVVGPSEADLEALEGQRLALEARRGEIERAHLEAVESEQQALRAKYAAAIESLEQAAAGMHRLLAEEVVDLALEVTRALLGKELSADRGLVTEAVEKALDAVSPGEMCVVKLHPADHAYVAEHRPELSGAEVRLVADGAMEVGGFVLESAKRSVDATASKRIAAVREALVAMVSDEQKEPV